MKITELIEILKEYRYEFGDIECFHHETNKPIELVGVSITNEYIDVPDQNKVGSFTRKYINGIYI